MERIIPASSPAFCLREELPGIASDTRLLAKCRPAWTMTSLRSSSAPLDTRSVSQEGVEGHGPGEPRPFFVSAVTENLCSRTVAIKFSDTFFKTVTT